MFIFILSSSRILVMNHNWSAIKQRLHLQSSRDKLPFSSVRGQDSPQGHKSMSVSHHFLPHALQSPSSVQKWFSRDHCFRGRSKPGCRIVGSHTRWELTTWADFQLCLQLWLLMSAGCMSCRSCFLDVSRSNRGLRISGWIGQLSCLKIVFIATLWEKKFCCRTQASVMLCVCQQLALIVQYLEPRVPSFIISYFSCVQLNSVLFGLPVDWCKWRRVFAV